MSPQPGGRVVADATEVGAIPLHSALGRVVIATTVLGSAVAMLTATVVNVALPTLATDLSASSAQQQWVLNAYTLTLASLILVGGSLGDRYGRVHVYRIGVVFFGLASLACAVAPTIGWLIAARLLQGIGGALLTPGSLAIIEATLATDDRAAGVGRWSGLGGVASASGPLLGGLLIDVAGWRWIFLLNLPLVVLVLFFSRRVPESSAVGAIDRRLDLGGAVLSTALLGSLSFAFIEGGSGFGRLVGVALALSVSSALALWAVERSHPNPLFPLALLRSRRFVVANIITIVLYGGMAVVFFLLSVNLQVVGGYSALQAGASLLPVTVLMLLFSARGGRLAGRIGPRLPLTIGPLLIAAGMLLLTRVGAEPSWFTEILPAVLVFGVGLTLTVAPVTSTALGAVPDDQAGTASGFNNAAARTGGLLTVAAIPPLVGLSGSGLSDPAVLGPAFADAVTIGAVMVAASGLLAAVTLGNKPEKLGGTPEKLGGKPEKHRT
ncbi:MAG: EmrB/QacA subfamily drug resistance transporter [Acidimicrobiales bacterium]